MTDDVQRLREEIFAKVAEFYRVAHRREPFVPGKTRIHYAGRVYDERELIAMTDAVLDFWLTLGRYADEFERKIAEFLGVSEVLLVNSGSSANLVAVTALCSPELDNPLRPGDEVITPAVTFPTTVAPLVQNGLIPVFVDCDLGTYNMNLAAVEAAISPRTRAILVLHNLGNPCDMDVILRLAQAHDLYVIEDTCDALGSRFGGRPVGSFGHLGTLSFYPAHHITTGEGGAVVTNDKKLARIARSIRDWGRACWCNHKTTDPNGACGRRFEYKIPGMPDTYDHKYVYSHIGYNLQPTDIQAALGSAQMDKLPDFIAARQRNFRLLFEGLARYQDFLILPQWDPRADVSWFAFPITVRDNPRFTRNDLVRWLEQANIETRLVFAGNILRQPGYVNIPHRIVGELINSNLVMRGSFFIGVYPGLDEERINYILRTFDAFFAQC
ncbi:MAG: lipopolysaccharide biosynthesis protein RfbH [Anaerolineae bacterium]|nr:lipopolysaccharide biosynthesis protein RfbH [Anaerolineae bacterium]